MILVHVYSSLHLLQLEFLKKKNPDSKIVCIIPKRLCSDLIRHDDIELISYEFDDPSSFKGTYLNYKVNSFISALLNYPYQFTKVYVPDIGYALNNMLVSALINDTKTVDFIYDGGISFLSTEMHWKDHIKDSCKLISSKLFSKFKYIKRGQQKNGVDLDICKNQISFIENESLPHSKKVLIDKNLIKLPPFDFSLCECIVIVAQDIDLVMPNYNKLMEKTLSYIKERYDYSTIYVVTRTQQELFGNDFTYVKRLHAGESAEAIIARLTPKAVISHNSTTLVHLAASNYQGDIISHQGYSFIKMCGHTTATATNTIDFFRSISIEIK